MVPIIICPQCVRYSASRGDVENGYCGACRRQTNGRVVELPDPGTVAAATREQALYALELYAGRARTAGADEDKVISAVRRGLGRWLLDGPGPAEAGGRAQRLLGHATDGEIHDPCERR